jgi:hypothetical protein
MMGSGKASEGSEITISAAKKEPLRLAASGGTMDTLARRGRVVPFGAVGIGCAVNTEVFSCKMKRMLSVKRSAP